MRKQHGVFFQGRRCQECGSEMDLHRWWRRGEWGYLCPVCPPEHSCWEEPAQPGADFPWRCVLGYSQAPSTQGDESMQEDWAVLSASEDGRWWLDSWHESRASAEARAAAIRQSDPRGDGSAVAIGDRPELCERHFDGCWRVRLGRRRLHVYEIGLERL